MSLQTPFYLMDIAALRRNMDIVARLRDASGAVEFLDSSGLGAVIALQSYTGFSRFSAESAIAGIVVLFKFQNLESATVSLFSMSITLPISVLVLLIYVLGMFTGGFVLSLLRSMARGATRRP